MRLLDWMPDELFLKLTWPKKEIGYALNLSEPKTFNEKLQWLKIHDRKQLYTLLADKYAVKQYVTEKIGAEYVIPVIGGPWKSAEEIDFETLPNRFVLKCNHDCGGMVICKDKSKLDILATRKKLSESLKINYYWGGREWPYKNIEPCIFAEQYMEDESGPDLKDYKFMVFNGKLRCSFVCTNRFSDKGMNVTFFDRQWSRMPFERKYHADDMPIPKPKCYEEMERIAEELAKGTTFSRIDLYEINGKVYFGEVTFFPGGGMEDFRPVEWDYTLGEWLKLPMEADNKEYI